jgi:hypothetical protein
MTITPAHQTNADPDDEKFPVTLNFVREYSMTIKLRAASQEEADKKALAMFEEHACTEGLIAAGLGLPQPWDEHESIDRDPEVEKRFRCVDCGKEAEYYTVAVELWASTGLAPNGGKLCLACLEKRIGREVTLDDFNRLLPLREEWKRHVAQRAAPPVAPGDLWDEAWRRLAAAIMAEAEAWLPHPENTHA